MVLWEKLVRSPYTTPLRLGTLGGLMNVSYIFILLESWFGLVLADEGHTEFFTRESRETAREITQRSEPRKSQNDKRVSIVYTR